MTVLKLWRNPIEGGVWLRVLTFVLLSIVTPSLSRQLPPTHHILMPRLRPILIHRHRLHDANPQVSVIPRNRAVRSNAHPLGHEFDVRLSIILARRSKARYYPMQRIAPIPPPIRPQQHKRRPKPIHHTPELTELPIPLHLRQPYPAILGTTSDIKRILNSATLLQI